MKTYQEREATIFNKFAQLVLKLYDHGEYVRTQSVEGIIDNLPLASRSEFEKTLKRLTKEFNFVHIRSEHYYLNMNLVESVKKDSVDGKLICRVTPKSYIRGFAFPDLILPYKYFSKLKKLIRR